MPSRVVLILGVFLIIAACGCQNIKDERLTTATLKKLQNSHDLTGKELSLLQGYVLRNGLANAITGGSTSALLDSTKTVRQAIADQQAWIVADSIRTADEKRKAAEALAAYEAEVRRLRDLVAVTVMKKRFVEYNYESAVVFQIVLANNGSQAVRGVKGSLRVTDLFGDIISNLEIKEDTPIAAGARVVRETGYAYNQFMDRDKKLRFTELSNMKFVWNPEIIIMADGSELGVPPAP